jgi:phosphate uptake regulator
MKRKVIKQGHNTLTITLPSKWALDHNIKAGDELNIDENNGSLIIGTDKKSSLGQIEIDVSKIDRTSIMYFIRAMYRRGYDEIFVHFDNPVVPHFRFKEKVRVASVINTEVNRLVGVEVIEQKENFCVISDISDDSTREFNTILRKVFLLTKDALNSLSDGVRRNDRALIESVEEKHDMVTKFVSYCLRILNKKGFDDHKKIPFLYFIIESLDMILDVLKYSARQILEYNKKFSKEGTEILSLMEKSFELFYDLFYKWDENKIFELNSVRESIIEKIKACSNIPPKELIIFSFMRNVPEIIREMSGARMSLQY